MVTPATAAQNIDSSSRTPPYKYTLAERLRKGDEITYLVTLAAAFSIILITVLLVWELWSSSKLPRHAFGWHFFTTSTWDPVSGDFGALPFIYGTVLTSAVGLVIAIPLGLGAAIFLAELAPRKISDGLTFLIELLAAVPSVIYGLIGIFVLIPILSNFVVPFLKKALGFLPIFGGPFYGVSYFSAGVILSLMIVPFIVSISREVLLTVPNSQREAMLALGGTKWDVTWRAVLPYARRGIAGSIFLALARALGETMAVTMVIGNVPQIKASLLAPGYTIAAVIANEFTEATGDLYLQALIELGLVLFLVTMNRQCIGAHTHADYGITRGKRMSRRYPPLSKRITNVVMLSLTGVCAFLTVSVLFFILGYLLYYGGRSLSLSFFTQLPAPVGQTGGGMANAIVGTMKLLGLATVIGIPIGSLGGVYLAEFGTGSFSFFVRYTTDLLNGVPSIVMGIFVYSLVVLPTHHFSTLAGGIALGIMMIPIAVRSTEEFLRAVPRSLRESGMALGASESETILTVVIPAALSGIITGIMLDLARVAGETAPLLFTSFGNEFWSKGCLQPTASLPVVIFNYAIAPYEDWHRQAWAAGFVLLSGILIVNIFARFVLSRRGHVAGR